MSAIDFWELAGISLTFGFAASLAFQRFADRALLAKSWKRLLAHFLELRLYVEDPVLILRGQRALLRENVNLLRSVIKPCAILLLPGALVSFLLFAWFGKAPLPAGWPIVVTAQLPASTTLHVPPGIVLETAGVRVLSEHQISWRIRPVHEIKGMLGRDFVPAVKINYPPAAMLGFSWAFWFFIFSFQLRLAFPETSL